LIETNRQLEEKSHALEVAGEELRHANDRLKEFDRLKDDFVSTVNHELRTPLTSIRSFSEILLDNPQLDIGRRNEFYAIIIRETERLTRLINQMLDLAKIQSGQFATVIAPVDLAAVVRDAMEAASQTLREKGTAVRVVSLPTPPMVAADRDLLMQVVINLLSNAAKFCPSGKGRVTISYASPGAEWAEFAVADNGPGVAPELREAVFERFRQVGDTLTDKPEGTGLGLTICRMIVTSLGGSIWVDAGPEGGAAFKVRLPTSSMVDGGSARVSEAAAAS
jgi:signal transduction histidine kinase